MNVKRLIHITGIHPQAFKIKRIEIAKDPCPVKVSQKEKEKILSTSKAQSIISSRVSSRRHSMDVSRASLAPLGDTAGRAIQNATQLEEGETLDPPDCENKPSLFAAEQTWPTEEEMQAAKNRRKVSDDDEMQMIDASGSKPEIGGFKPIIPQG